MTKVYRFGIYSNLSRGIGRNGGRREVADFGLIVSD